MRSPKIVIVGHICIDQNKAEHTTYTDWGSGAIYISDYLQQHLGCTPEIITTYGPDFLKYSHNFHIHPSQPNADKTLINENIMSGKEKERIRYSHNAEASTPPELTAEAIGLIEQADILLVTTLLSNYNPSYIAELMSHTSAHCLKALIVQGYLRSVNDDGSISLRDFPEAAEVLPHFNLAVLSDDDHPDALALTQKWKRQVPNTAIILTQGPQGASIIDADNARNIPTTPVSPDQIVDSVGCGDLFMAALAYHYFQTNELSSSIMAGHRAARKKLLSNSTSS
jgi:sugar/nucleoside kinase (ribokinase family)